MADIHVLSGNGHGQVNVVLHFDVPAGDNAVSVSWKDALLNSGKGGPTSMTVGDGPLQIPQAEADLIAAGDRHEIHRTFQINSIVDTADSRRDALREFCTEQKAAAILDLQGELRYAGYTEDVI